MDKIEYEGYGLYVVIKSNCSLVVEERDGKFFLPFAYGLKGETTMKCARRIIRKTSLTPPLFLKSLPYVKREDASLLKKEARGDWPLGMKSFPIYAYLCEMEEGELSPSLPYRVIERSTWDSLPLKEREIVSLCNRQE